MLKRKDATRVSLAYRYHNPNWDLAQNLLVYGSDHSVAGIGGNLTLWLEMAGEVDSRSQLLIPEKSLDSALAELKSRLDHRCLFEVEPWFESRVPSLENIALFLAVSLTRSDWYSLTVEENENWRVQIFRLKQKNRLTYSSFHNSMRFDVTLEGEIDPVSGLMVRREPVRATIEEWLGKLDRLSSGEVEKLQRNLPQLVAVQARNATKTALEWCLV